MENIRIDQTTIYVFFTVKIALKNQGEKRDYQ
jgi:hypothetical protein